MKIIYASVHHQNTKKVVDYLMSHVCAKTDAVDIMSDKSPDIENENLIILASGIYFSTFHKAMLDYIRRTDFSGKKCVLLYTCGLEYRNYAKKTAKLLAGRGANYIGSCRCRGFDTYGPLKRIGGIAKNHPNAADMSRVLQRIEQLILDNA